MAEKPVGISKNNWSYYSKTSAQAEHATALNKIKHDWSDHLRFFSSISKLRKFIG